MMSVKKLTKKIKQSGLAEFTFLSFSILLSGIVSRCRIFFLRIRRYKVDYTTDLKPYVVMFQTKKDSILIKDHSRIGFAVRLKAGFDGKITIGRNVWLDDFSFIHSQEEIKIGDGCMIATSVYIVDFDHKIPIKLFDFKNMNKNSYVTNKVIIGKNVWIGANAVILRGVIIGDNAVIGAGSVVTKPIPADSVAVGVPAKVIKRFRKS